MIRYRNFTAAMVVGLTTLSGCSTASSRLDPLAAVAPSPYRVGAGDEVRISVGGLDAITNTYVIGDTGMISLPMLAPIAVAGRTVAEMQDAIAQELRTRQLVNDPNVQAQVVKYRPFFILGEVQRPGQYPYVPGMSVLNAVSIAGGYTFRAQRKYAAISRPAGDRIVEGRAGPNTPILPGDTVTIDESWF